MALPGARPRRSGGRREDGKSHKCSWPTCALRWAAFQKVLLQLALLPHAPHLRVLAGYVREHFFAEDSVGNRMPVPGAGYQVQNTCFRCPPGKMLQGRGRAGFGKVERGAVLFIFFRLSGLRHMHFWLLSCWKRKGDMDRRMARAFRAGGSPARSAQSTDSMALLFVSGKVRVSALVMPQSLCRGKRSARYCIWWENKAGGD